MSDSNSEQSITNDKFDQFENINKSNQRKLLEDELENLTNDNLNKMNISNQSDENLSKENDCKMLKLNDILTINEIPKLILKLNFNTRSNITKKLTLLNNLISNSDSLNNEIKINLLKENANLISYLNELPIYLENKTNQSNEEIIKKCKETFKNLKNEDNDEFNINTKQFTNNDLELENDEKLDEYVKNLLNIKHDNQYESKLNLSKDLLNTIITHYYNKILDLIYKNYLEFNSLNQDDVNFTDLFKQFQTLQQLDHLLSKSDLDKKRKEDKIIKKQELVLQRENNSRSEGVFSFRVKNISNKLNYDEIKELSDTFYVRDLPWRLSIKFKKNDSSTKFGFYLECNRESNSLNWSCKATADLFLISQKPSVNHIKRTIDNCIFNSKKYYHGFEEFTDIDTIIDSDFGYSINDSIILQVHLKANLPIGLRLDLRIEDYGKIEDNLNNFSSIDNEYDYFLKEIDIMLNTIKRFNPKLNEISTWFTNYETYCKLFKWTDNQIYCNLLYFLDSSLICVCINDKNDYEIAKKRIIRFINDLTYSNDNDSNFSMKINEILEIFEYYRLNECERKYWLSYYLPINEIIKKLETISNDNNLIQLIKIHFL